MMPTPRAWSVTRVFTAASALLNYILGVGGQNAANARAHRPDTNRTEFLGTVSAAWANLDPDDRTECQPTPRL